jgi:hypothetical protein
MPRELAIRIPHRDVVIHALTLIGVPASTALVSAVIEATHPGHPPVQYAGLRRDEARAGKPIRVVAAIDTSGEPVRATLALSSWPLADQIIAHTSPPIYAAISTANLTAAAAGYPELSDIAARLSVQPPSRRMVDVDRHVREQAAQQIAGK